MKLSAKLSILIILSVTVIGCSSNQLGTYPDDPSIIPNSYLMTYTTTIKKPPEEVFNFLTYRFPAYYQSVATAHDKFEIVNADGMTEGAIINVEEYEEEEGVKHRYVVHKVTPNRYIYKASTPSIIYRLSNGEMEEEGTCSTHVYLFMKENGDYTDYTQTLVIEMPNLAVKLISDFIILFSDENVWQAHLEEEVEGMKVAIENGL